MINFLNKLKNFFFPESVSSIDEITPGFLKKKLFFILGSVNSCFEGRLAEAKKVIRRNLVFSKISELIKNYDNNYLGYEKEQNNVNLENLKTNKIIKQNKSLTPFEVASHILTSGSNKSKFYNPMHSFLPIIISGLVFSSLIILIAIFFRDDRINQKNWPLLIFILGLFIALFFWFSMFYLEKRMGKHIDLIRHNIVFGFYLFIFTEGLCFLALFWTFLHSTLAASVHVGIYNPGEGVVNFYISETFRVSKNWDLYNYHTWGTPGFYNLSTLYFITDIDLYKFKKIKTHVNLYDSGSLINPWKLPFINTLILLSSAASLNASHCYILVQKYLSCLVSLFVTILFGLLFVFMQYTEYKSSVLNYNDGIFASCFFGITGLHGIHVILGIIALTVCFFNICLKNYSPKFHQTFYFSIFYWHFVDIIWIAVWFIIYLWPGSFFFYDYYLSCYEKDFFIYNLNTDYFLDTIDYNAWFNFYEIDSLIYKTTYQKKPYINAYTSVLLPDIKVINSMYESYNYSVAYNDQLLAYAEIMEFSEQQTICWIVKNRIKVPKLMPECVFDWNKFEYKMELEESYCIFLDNYKYFNFNIIKKNVMYYCIFMNEMHVDICNCVYNPIADDIANKYPRFFLYLILNFIMPKPITLFYLNWFFSPWYYYNV